MTFPKLCPLKTALMQPARERRGELRFAWGWKDSRMAKREPMVGIAGWVWCATISVEK
jgi:hypothetical protein